MDQLWWIPPPAIACICLTIDGLTQLGASASCAELQCRQANTKICLKIIQKCPKIEQKWSNCRSKFIKKSGKIGPKALLESSGGHRGPKMAPPKVGPKLIRNVIFLFIFLYSIFGIIRGQFGPNLAPQTLPKWSQVGFKSHPKFNQAVKNYTLEAK